MDLNPSAKSTDKPNKNRLNRMKAMVVTGLKMTQTMSSVMIKWSISEIKSIQEDRSTMNTKRAIKWFHLALLAQNLAGLAAEKS